MTQQPLTPRPAATLILVRDSPQGIETFMMQRTHQAAFGPGGYVFPGGSLDPADADHAFATHCAGFDDLAASRLLKLEQGGLAYWVAAIRECFEESGLLLAYDGSERLIELADPAIADEFSGLRQKLAAGEVTLAGLCRSHGLRLALDRMIYYGHWITPVGAPRRFDTRFFLALAPDAQQASHDRSETIDDVWIRPSEALERHRTGEIKLMFATRTTLESLARFANAGQLMDHARATGSTIMAKTPRVSVGREGGREERRVLAPDHHAYAEVGKLDPAGKGHVSCEILPGVMTRLSDKVRRIAAPNPSFMTGPGTNSYLLGAGDEIAIIDPGPADEAHVERLIEQANGRIRWILTTHTHIDHSPAAALLKARTGAQVLGMPAPDAGHQDRGFQPDIILAHGQRIELGGCTLRAIHTPGHASNHLCYLLEDERLLFTGDHIMQGSTVVINPPDGDMSVYLASLHALKSLEIDYLAPGHGFLMDKPYEAVDRLLAHRLAREAKILGALRKLGAATIEELLPLAYDDVSARRHGMASRSLLAHLFKLEAEGRVSGRGGRWRIAGLEQRAV